MINTAAFESVQRMKKLTEALEFLKLHPNSCITYYWLWDPIQKAINREAIFAENNSAQWRSQIGAPQQQDKRHKSSEDVLAFIDDELALNSLEAGTSFYAGLVQGQVTALEMIRDFILGVERE